jgi:two-component system, OmpR family, sensor histidine kinase CreC
VRLGTRLFLAFLGIFLVCFSYPIARIAKGLRVAYLESAEEPLVDEANLLAAFVAGARHDGILDAAALERVFADVASRRLDARIYDLRKERVDLRVTVTDAKGMLLYDSAKLDKPGTDYSQWRDVHKTLQGEYGARIGRDPNDADATTTLYVAAPVLQNGDIVGVVTVGKPTVAVNAFVESARPRVFGMVAVSAGGALLLSLLASLWVRQQVGRLTGYANDVRAGRRVPFPRLAKTELRSMGQAFERMRASLDGQTYIAQYVQALTHEIKSPISAIRGAAEILEDAAVPADKRGRFLRNIQSETVRIQNLVDRMLSLSELEVRRALPARAPVQLAVVVRATLGDVAAPLAAKGLTVDVRVAEDLQVEGDEFLLRLAVSNLLQNAVDFSPAGGALTVEAARRPPEGGVKPTGDIELSIVDQGPGIPDFARARVFEKFFSLQRPDSGRKSTGLGLNLVKEVATLHGGSVDLANLPDRGLRASLRLPG